MRALSLPTLLKVLNSLKDASPELRIRELAKLKAASDIDTGKYPEWRSRVKCKGKRDASRRERSNRRKGAR